MLVLSRHRNESIMIGDDVMISIIDIRGDKVRLGIDAPQEIPVHRQEVYDAIKREQKSKFESDMDKLEAHAIRLHNRYFRSQITSLTELTEKRREEVVNMAAKELGL